MHFVAPALSRPSTPSPLCDRGWNAGESGRTSKQSMYVIWDICSLPPPPATTHVQVVDAARAFVYHNNRQVDSFVAYIVAGSLHSSVQQQIRDTGVRLEECFSNKQSRSCDVHIVTQMLAMALPATVCVEGAPCSKPSLLLLSDDRDLLPALALLRRSGHFDQILLVHSGGHTADRFTVPLTQLLHCHPAGATRSIPLADWQEKAELTSSHRLSRSSTGNGIPGGITPPSSEVSSPCSTPPSLASYRSLHPTPHSCPSNHLCLSPTHIGECLQAFASVVQCCEREKIIPRESVLRKKLLDGHYAPGVEFEDFLTCVVGSGMGVVEGCSPQRVVWPREGQTARRFACADFFQPTQRLSSEQTEELIAFLYRARPEVERGRFGFAQWLSRYGPYFIQCLPHGVLVELVQLLLNKRVLQFRKGRVSVTALNSATACSSASALASEFSSSASNCTLLYANSANNTAAGRSSCAGEKFISGTATISLISVPCVSTPSDRAFIPASVLPFSTPFNAVDLLSSLCSLCRSIAPSSYRQYPSHLPLYHFEQTATPSSSSPVWVSVCTVVFRGEMAIAHSVARQFKSTQHESQDTARQESARRALQDTLWYLCFDRCLTELKHLENRHREGECRRQREHIQREEQQRSEAEERYQQQTADSVTQLDRHLAFLSQPAIVYTLQSHVMQDSVGARTMWKARGQVMLDGQLLPGDKVRLQAWNGSELIMSSTPVVSYAAQSRKTQAKELVSQQLIGKLAAVTARLNTQPTRRQPSNAKPPMLVSATHASPPHSALHESISVEKPSVSKTASVTDSNMSWRPPSTRPTARSCVPIASNTLFAFPSYNDLPQSSSAQRQYDHSQFDEYGVRYDKEEGDGKCVEEGRAEGEEVIQGWL